jgi:hypothetical protein
MLNVGITAIVVKHIRSCTEMLGSLPRRYTILLRISGSLGDPIVSSWHIYMWPVAQQETQAIHSILCCALLSIRQRALERRWRDRQLLDYGIVEPID